MQGGIHVAKFATVDEYLAALPTRLLEVGEKVRPIIDAGLPDASVAVWHGHPTWSLGDIPGKKPVCLLKAYSTYVSFGLWRGQAITDPSGRLEPGAREMAYVKLGAATDVDAELFSDWLRQARDLELSQGT